MKRNSDKKWSKNKGNKKGYQTSKDEAENSKSDAELKFGTKPNDLSWYVVSDQVLRDVASIPYNIPVGMPYSRYGTFAPTGVNLQSYDEAFPGILVSHLMPGLGAAYSPSDAVNVAANSVFQFVRSKISGNRTYEAVDMMLYLGCMDSVFCNASWMTRAYATAFTYHQSNRYLAKTMLTAQHIDYDDLIANLANFRSGFNMRIAKIRSLYLPSILPIFKRHAWLFQNYYIEGPTEKDQIYMHVPEGYYVFGLDSSNRGMMHGKRIDTSGPLLKYTDLLKILDDMIDPIYQDEDFNRISGDMMKAYEGNVFTLTELPDIATVSLIYNEEVLMQFKNGKYKYVHPDLQDGSEFDQDFFDYFQDSTGLILQSNVYRGALSALSTYMFVFNTGNNSSVIVNASSPTPDQVRYANELYEWSKAKCITSKSSDVTPGENMINTRLTLSLDVVADGTTPQGGKITDVFFGTEWPVRYDIVTFHRNRNTSAISTFTRHYDLCLHLDINNDQAIQQIVESQLPIRSCFKYLPELSILISDSANNDATNAGRTMFDVDNYAFIGNIAIRGLHNAAILGEYNIPSLAISK